MDDTQAPIIAPAPLTLRQAEIDIARKMLDGKRRGWHKHILLRHLSAVNHNPGVYIQSLRALVERGEIVFERGWYRANDKTAKIVGVEG